MTIPAPELPELHRRTYDVVAYKQSETDLLLRGSVRDVKPAGVYIPGDTKPMTIHHMVVDLVVEFPSLVVTGATVVMETHPHHECPRITDHYEKLIGLSIARGFTHKVRELFGGPRGCTHTTALLQAMAPVVIQSMWSMMQSVDGETPVALSVEQKRERVTRNLNTCHVWAEDGPMFTELDAGRDIPAPIWALERLEELGMDPAGWYAAKD